jgi:hypothetical protein
MKAVLVVVAGLQPAKPFSGLQKKTIQEALSVTSPQLLKMTEAS